MLRSRGMVEVAGTHIARFKVLGKNAPRQIYCQGKWDEKMFVGSVAIVGSRRMTDYGRRVLERMIPILIGQGKTVISGFMYGVDMTAHLLTLAEGGRTVAVLGWGIDYPMADDQCQISNQIVQKGGLVISEWKDQPGALWTFPQRNRIVAALCDELVVVEAAAKSGALITAGLAIKYGKPVWAVPGPVTSKVSEGTNKLISQGKTKIWLAESLRVEEQESVSNDNVIIRLIENEGMDVSEIARRLNKPAEEVGAELTMLVLSGQVEEREGKYYRNDQ